MLANTRDLIPIGSPSLRSYAIGFDPGSDLLVVTSGATEKAYTFALAGAYVKTWDLDTDVQTSYRMGFTKGQLFVFDQVRNGWPTAGCAQ